MYAQATNSGTVQHTQPMCTSSLTGMENLVRQFHQTTTHEVKMEAQVIFDACWRRLEDRYGIVSPPGVCMQLSIAAESDRILVQANIRCPREVVWLNGAPGAGKVRVVFASYTHTRPFQHAPQLNVSWRCRE
jgi:hypothetical protein